MAARSAVRASSCATSATASEPAASPQELLVQHRDKVERAFLAGLEDRSPLTRLRAAEGLVKLALGAERIGVVEQHHEEQALDRAQLLAILSQKLCQGPAAALMRRHLAEPVLEVQEAT